MFDKHLKQIHNTCDYTSDTHDINVSNQPSSSAPLHGPPGAANSDPLPGPDRATGTGTGGHGGHSMSPISDFEFSVRSVVK